MGVGCAGRPEVACRARLRTPVRERGVQFESVRFRLGLACNRESCEFFARHQPQPIGHRPSFRGHSTYRRGCPAAGGQTHLTGYG